MIAQPDLRREFFALDSTATIATEALMRIPVAHFRSMSWAKDAIAACTAMLAAAACGDPSSVRNWVRSIGTTGGAQPAMAVLRAVCDAVLADAFRSHNDASAVSAFIASVERDVRGRLATQSRQKHLQALDDPATDELAAGLVRIVKLADPETATHLEATAVLARRIATAMMLPREQVRTIELVGRLHDIGKVGQDRQLYRKPGELTASEWNEVRRHAENGATALADMPKLAALAPLIRAHHERVDGSGYPDRLRGPEIPLESRIVAVADAFHAMTSQRPYRRPTLPHDALAVLAENAGSQFDSEVVDATLGVLRFTSHPRRQIA